MEGEFESLTGPVSLGRGGGGTSNACQGVCVMGGDPISDIIVIAQQPLAFSPGIPVLRTGRSRRQQTFPSLRTPIGRYDGLGGRGEWGAGALANAQQRTTLSALKKGAATRSGRLAVTRRMPAVSRRWWPYHSSWDT